MSPREVITIQDTLLSFVYKWCYEYWLQKERQPQHDIQIEAFVLELMVASGKKDKHYIKWPHIMLNWAVTSLDKDR